MYFSKKENRSSKIKEQSFVQKVRYKSEKIYTLQDRKISKKYNKMSGNKFKRYYEYAKFK